jgi:hypothetical protein
MTSHPILPAGPNGGQDSPIPLAPLLLQELVEALRTIRYGTIELVIHDGRVVQLERREKVRFEQGSADHRRG